MTEHRRVVRGHDPAMAMPVSTVLFVDADPTGGRRLRLDEEQRAIEEAIRNATFRRQIGLGGDQPDAVLGDLGRRRETLRAIESAFRVITDDDHDHR